MKLLFLVRDFRDMHQLFSFAPAAITRNVCVCLLLKAKLHALGQVVCFTFQHDEQPVNTVKFTLSTIIDLVLNFPNAVILNRSKIHFRRTALREC